MMNNIFMDIAPLSPAEIIWYEYGTVLVIGGIAVAAAAVFLIIKVLRKKK